MGVNPIQNLATTDRLGPSLSTESSIVATCMYVLLVSMPCCILFLLVFVLVFVVDIAL